MKPGSLILAGVALAATAQGVAIPTATSSSVEHSSSNALPTEHPVDVEKRRVGAPKKPTVPTRPTVVSTKIINNKPERVCVLPETTLIAGLATLTAVDHNGKNITVPPGATVVLDDMEVRCSGADGQSWKNSANSAAVAVIAAFAAAALI